MRFQLAPALTLALLSPLPLHAQQQTQSATKAPDGGLAPDAPATLSATDATSPVGEHAPGESLARIVRLSQERGTVEMDRNTGNGFEQAMPNMPLVQGVRLRTGDGLAEVEFEDNSSLRLTPGTEVDFPELKLRQTGAKVSLLDVKRGSVYVSMADTRDNDFRVQFAGRTLTLSPSAHIHLLLGNPEIRLTVLNGEARVEGPDGVEVVNKKQTATFDTAGSKPPEIAKGVVHDAYDEWDKNEVDYQKRYALASSFGAASPYGYGLADLSYYGSFINTGGCGQIWQPYLISAGWSPYSAGVWTWYPGMGYSWVSMYPWGWTPFHSGEWAFCQGTGWGWRPTGGWSGINNLHRLKLTGNGGGTPIKPVPPNPPRPRQPTMTLANTSSGRAPLPVSGVQPTGEFVFRNNSAGLGVPRGAFRHLNKISVNVQQHGAVTTTPNLHLVNTLNAAAVGPSASSGSAAGRNAASAVNRTPPAGAPRTVGAPAATHISAPAASAPRMSAPASSAPPASSHK